MSFDPDYHLRVPRMLSWPGVIWRIIAGAFLMSAIVMIIPVDSRVLGIVPTRMLVAGLGVLIFLFNGLQYRHQERRLALNLSLAVIAGLLFGVCAWLPAMPALSDWFILAASLALLLTALISGTRPKRSASPILSWSNLKLVGFFTLLLLATTGAPFILAGLSRAFDG